jgi:hypothetical protein
LQVRFGALTPVNRVRRGPPSRILAVAVARLRPVSTPRQGAAVAADSSNVMAGASGPHATDGSLDPLGQT